MNTLVYYFAFKRLKNFACIEVHPNSGKILAYVKVDPDAIDLKTGFTGDVRKIGHYGTGDLEVVIANHSDLESARPQFLQSYEVS
jgi:predicted transport protein